MNRNSQKHIRILAIAPSAGGFGFAVLEGREALIACGCKPAGADKNASSLAKVEKLIARYQPGVIVLQNALDMNSRRAPRIQELVERISGMAKVRQIRVVLLSFREVRQIYFGDKLGTKYTLAEVLAAWFPELADRLPPKRRLGSSEDSRMDIFDAVALALAYGAKNVEVITP